MDLAEKEIEKIAAGPMVYEEIKEKYGEEVAIGVGIVRNPNTWKWSNEDFARARPPAEVMSRLAERWCRDQARKNLGAVRHLLPRVTHPLIRL